MDDSLHYLMMVNQAMFHKELLNGLKGTELTLGQPKILDYLIEHEGSSQKDIAAGCHIEAASLTSLLTRMESKGMLERRTLNGNRRTFYIFLTDYGKQLQKRVEVEIEALEKKAFGDIKEEDKAAFFKVMEQISQNLTKENK